MKSIYIFLLVIQKKDNTQTPACDILHYIKMFVLNQNVVTVGNSKKWRFCFKNEY